MPNSRICNVTNMSYNTIRENKILAKRGSFMVWEFDMGVCPRLEFDNIMFTN